MALWDKYLTEHEQAKPAFQKREKASHHHSENAKARLARARKEKHLARQQHKLSKQNSKLSLTED